MQLNVKNILILIVSIFIGMLVNGGLIGIGSSIIPPPEEKD